MQNAEPHLPFGSQDPSALKIQASRLFSLLTRLRAFLYRKGVFRSHRLKSPVISVGNLTVGGTGKTPVVAYLARVLIKSGSNPVILSRGYGGSPNASVTVVSDRTGCRSEADQSGDEPYMLARQLPGVPVVVSKDRVLAGRRAEELWAPVTLILDDGFQHLRLQRDLNLLLIDATDPFGNGFLLPAGRLREPRAAARRADLVIITRAHFADTEQIELELRRYHPHVTISYFHHDAVGIYDLSDGTRHRISDFFNQQVVVMTGLGNPAVFLRDLEHYQIGIAETRLVRDHHRYVQAELDKALSAVERHRAVCLLTTEKDAVWLQRLRFSSGQVCVFEIEAKPEDPDGFETLLRDELKACLDLQPTVGSN